MFEILMAAGGGLLAGFGLSGLLHRARYRAWSLERELLKSQIVEDDEDGSNIDLDEIVETALHNRAMGVPPIGLVSLLVEQRERAAGARVSGIDRSIDSFWRNQNFEAPKHAMRCECSFCRAAEDMRARQKDPLISPSAALLDRLRRKGKVEGGR